MQQGAVPITTLQQAAELLQQSERSVLESGAAVRSTLLTLFTRYGLSEFYVDETFRTALLRSWKKGSTLLGLLVDNPLDDAQNTETLETLSEKIKTGYFLYDLMYISLLTEVALMFYWWSYNNYSSL